MGNASLENAIEAYEQLRKFAPKSREILYNLTSLQLEGLAAGMNLSPSVIQKQINTLRAMKLDKSLLTRLTINYKIVMTEWYQLHNEYGKKASTLRSIQNDYGKTAFTDDELLRIAKYLSNYRQFTAAIKLLRKRALTSDAPFELQHYYLLLTIGNSEMYQDEHYTDFIDLFQQKYPESICQLFAPKTKGGYSFQLLEHAFWRNRYCELCH